MNFTMEDRDAEEFILVIQGYYRLLTERELYVNLEKDMWTQESGIYRRELPLFAIFRYADVKFEDVFTAPSYHSRHVVCTAPWNYATHSELHNDKYVDFTSTPQYTYPQECNSYVIFNSTSFYFYLSLRFLKTFFF